MKIGKETMSARRWVSVSASWAVAALLLSACSPSERTSSGLRASQGQTNISVADHHAAAAAGIPAPRVFETRHEMTIGGQKIAFKATAGETFIYSDDGEPAASLFSYSYVKESKTNEQRPVVFVTGGGPGSASNILQLGVLGPWVVPIDRLAILEGEQPGATPPYPIEENAHSLLDVADLVFIDPIGTGYSRAVGKGKNEDFWGIDEDADSVAQFMHTWVSRRGRWDSPKFFLGESYGGTRAALVARAINGGPNYPGILRAMPLNGVISVVNGLGLPVGNEGIGPIAGAVVRMPGLAATAWYHQTIDRAGRTLDEYFNEAYRFATTEYLAAAQKEAKGELRSSERASVVARIVSYTGLPAAVFDQSLIPNEMVFAEQMLADRGLTIGMYDSRYTLPAGRGGGDPAADDAALARSFPVVSGALHNAEYSKLKVAMDRPFVAIRWRGLLDNWKFEHGPVTFGEKFKGNNADELAAMMRRNDRMHLMVASGYYDLVVPAAMGRYATALAGIPTDRLVVKEYAGGHEPYFDAGNRHVFVEDVREFIRKASEPSAPRTRTAPQAVH